MKRSYRCSLYDADFEFVIGEPLKQLQKRYNGLESIHPNSVGLTFETEEGDIVVWIKNKRDYAVLAHECVHAAGKLLSYKGVKADWKNDEPMAYLVSALFNAARGIKK